MSAKLILILSSLLIGSISQAQAVNVYTCTLRVVDASNDMLIEEVFQANEINGSHGGETKTFTSKDGKSQVAVAVDGKWILLNWTKNNKAIANVVFVVGNASVEPRVALVYNPEDTAEQASVDCQPNFTL